MTGRQEISDQEAYYNEIIRSVIRTGRAAELVIAFCNLIRRLVVDHLHVVGDIFDRGPYPNLIMDTLITLWTSSGAITMCTGWERRRAVRHASVM